VSGWPSIAEPELLERLTLSDREFESYIRDLAGKWPSQAYEDDLLERALGYPWTRPVGSFVLTNDEVVLLRDLEPEEREVAIERHSSSADGRVPVLAIGSNAAPEVLERKFAHHSEERDRTVLGLTGRLQGFDVGASPHPALYGAMPATLFPSAGTEVGTTLLWVTPAQFTQLTWSEISYRLGKLRARFEVEETKDRFEEVICFVSRFGAFCVEDRPVALGAVPARSRTAIALTQEELLDAAATLAIGPGANAETLIRALFEDRQATVLRIAETVWRESQRFGSERWSPFEGEPSPG
jgi:hypothetical protein